MKLKKFCFFLLLSVLAVACKPTEKGYKTAYDAALGKRQAAIADIDANLPEGAFQDFDGPQLKDIDGVKVYMLNQAISPVLEGVKLPGRYNVAVGKFKMITNCQAQATSLTQEGFEAFPAKDPEGNYFTIAGSFDTPHDAVVCYEKLTKDINRGYVGLPNSPVIIFSPK